jgi:hypothetical protein
MTREQKQAWKELFVGLSKTSALIVGVGWISWQCFVVRPAQAALATPTVSTFTFKDAWGKDYSVTSWFADGLKCTSVTAAPFNNSNSASVSVSCAKP